MCDVTRMSERSVSKSLYPGSKTTSGVAPYFMSCSYDKLSITPDTWPPKRSFEQLEERLYCASPTPRFLGLPSVFVSQYYKLSACPSWPLFGVYITSNVFISNRLAKVDAYPARSGKR